MAEVFVSEAEFLTRLADEFQQIGVEEVTPDLPFKQVQGWSSMFALMLIVQIDELLQVSLSAEDLKQVQTLGELYRLALTRQVAK
jgi:acyl carrier protein